MLAVLSGVLAVVAAVMAGHLFCWWTNLDTAFLADTPVEGYRAHAVVARLGGLSGAAWAVLVAAVGIGGAAAAALARPLLDRRGLLSAAAAAPLVALVVPGLVLVPAGLAARRDDAVHPRVSRVNEIAALGIELPENMIWRDPGSPPLVTVSRERLLFDGQDVDRQPERDSMIWPLFKRLDAAGTARERAVAPLHEDVEWYYARGTIRLEADRRLTLAELEPVLATAIGARMSDVRIITVDPEGLALSGQEITLFGHPHLEIGSHCGEPPGEEVEEQWLEALVEIGCWSEGSPPLALWYELGADGATLHLDTERSREVALDGLGASVLAEQEPHRKVSEVHVFPHPDLTWGAIVASLWELKRPYNHDSADDYRLVLHVRPFTTPGERHLDVHMMGSPPEFMGEFGPNGWRRRHEGPAP